jgi:hypothetical protein
MQYLGEPVEKDFLMGVSGGAFKMYWIPPWSPANCDLLDIGEEPVRRTFAALGYDYTYLGNYLRNNPAYTKEFYRQHIVTSIDAGRPVIAMGIVGPPECGIVAGYDKDGGPPGLCFQGDSGLDAAARRRAGASADIGTALLRADLIGTEEMPSPRVCVPWSGRGNACRALPRS